MALRSKLARSSLRRSGSGTGNGGVDQIIAGTNITISPVSGVGVVTINASGSSASWPLANPRVYAVDGALGNDANAGFADAAGTSAPQYAAACAAAGLVAKKTLAGLAAIFPALGAGRIAVILIKAGTYTDDLATVLGGIEGYASGSPLVRGTVTNATASSVAFAGDAADETMSGGVTATGLNAPGYHPTGAPTSSQFQCLTLGGGAPGFAAEPAVPLGWRVRFDSATTTAALRNQCRQVTQVSGTDTLLLQTVLPAVPVAADTFYLEMAGVVIPAINLAAPANGQLGIQFSGIRSSGTWGLQFMDAQFAFCGANALVAQQQTVNELGVSQSYTNPILGAITPGGGFRSETTVVLNQGYQNLLGLVSTTSTTLTSDQAIVWGAGSVARNVAVINSRLGQNVDTTAPATLGTTSATGIPHTFGNDGVAAIAIDGSDLTLQQCNVFNAGAFPCIQLRGKCSIIFAGSVGGTTGNTDVGLDLQNSAGSQIQILATAAPTVSGSTANVRWSGPAFGTWTQFQNQEQYDTAGNHIYQVVVNAEYNHAITPSVSLQVNNSGGTANAYNFVSHSGASGQFKPAVAGDVIVGVLDRQTGNGEAALVGAASGYRVVNFDAAPTLGSLVYVSATAGLATITNPGNQSPLGVVTDTSFAGNLAIVHFLGGAISPSIPAANWTLGLCRVYAIDFVNGLDTNKGFADPATSSAGNYAVACAAAGAVAKKTFAGLSAIFPKFGAGRLVEIVIANGGSNTVQNYAEDIGLIVNGVEGYGSGCPAVRGTGTNTTAGCTAFDGSVADVTYQGGITVTGLNAAGYNPVGASTSSLPCQLAGGGAAALPAEPAAPLGWRVRFDAATTTVGLRNQCRQIAQVSGGNTIVPQTAFSNAPANADVFYIEQAGVTWSVAANLSGGGVGTAAPNGMQFSGLRSTTSVELQSGRYHFSFFGCGSLVPAGGTFCFGEITTTQFYLPPVAALGASILVGGGLRSEGVTSIIVDAGLIKLAGLVSVGNLSVSGTGVIQWLAGCYCPLLSMSFRSQSVVFKGLSPLANDIGAASNVVLALPRCEGGFITAGECVFAIGTCVIENCTARAAVEIQGHNIVTFASVVSGTTGNNDVGLDLQNSIGSLVILLATPTVTGALGDIRLAGGQIITWAQAVATGIQDSQGNRIIGVGAPPLGWTHFSGAIIGGAGATVSYLGDAGIIGAVNQTTAFRRATSLRLMLRLRVTSISNTSANAVTCTLYKNGVATAMQVSIPAATAANTKFVDSAHPILFADGDDLDLRLDDAADVGAQVNVSAGLEWAT